MANDQSPAFARWKWRTFPVFAALMVGLTIGTFIDGRPDTDLGVVVRVLALVGFAYVLIHLFVTNVIVAGRIKRRAQSTEDGDAEFEDVVVQPDE